jgi:hypothetical protein
MKKFLLRHVAACCVLAPVAGVFVTPALAAPNVTSVGSSVPVTRGLEVNADNGIAAGSQLRLALDGSPGGEAAARLPGANVVVPLKEVAPGQYSGRYTVRRTDRIDPAAVIRVSLTVSSQTVIANYTFPSSFMAPLATAAAPVRRDVIAAVPTPAPVPPPAVVEAPRPPLRIDAFALAPLGRAEPGSELQFRLAGAPGASASFDIPGIVSNAPMREVRPGRYEGSYVIRQRDNLAAAGQVTATLRVDNRLTTAALSQPLVGDNRPPQIGNLMPREGEAVRGPTRVSGSFDDAQGAGVDPRSVRIVISGRDVTGLAQVTPRDFSFQGTLPPGRQTVEVTAADRAGNVAQKSWSFDVGATVLGASSVVLPLLVLSHANNALVDDTTTIRGRTAPGAVLRVRVDFTLPPGGILSLGGPTTGVAEPLLSETVQADANGDFSFTFHPRYTRDNATSKPVPGTRYDVSIRVERENQSAESRLMLFQRS